MLRGAFTLFIKFSTYKKKKTWKAKIATDFSNAGKDLST
jgi:hypothetical protein